MKEALRGDANTTRWLYYKAVKKIHPTADRLPVGTGRPKFNQLEVVTIYFYLQTQIDEDRCT